ncbi:ABC transporter substrate-binding protein [Microvirga lotononidis]|uniref:ABC transporter substrate-binding protein n=1 Tax=Microvirga lotononidis TaxID=864069 RepID=UPI0002EF3999|nr:ABC transporter substrate-binding protein [Microvirga lotononidis]WQO31596.1 ABC transporter substrate-binding protein [Microvirga lotononidis]
MRIASLDFALVEQLIVLGAPPIAVAEARDWNKWVKEPPLPTGTIDLGTSFAPNIELLAALGPDLILTTDFVAMVEPRVSGIAPVERISIYSPGGSPLPKAVASMRHLGAILGLQNRVEAYLQETEAFFDACAERARPFCDKPILMLSFLDPRHARVYARPGLQQDVLDRIGLRNAWPNEGSYWGFGTVGIERLVEAGEAVAVTDYMPPDVRAVLETSPLWRSLPIRRAGGPIPILPPVLAFGGVPAARRWATLLLDALEERNP